MHIGVVGASPIYKPLTAATDGFYIMRVCVCV
jgi:hypothetical protein